MDADLELLRLAADLALADVGSVDDRSVAPSAEALSNLSRFDESLPERGADAAESLRLLHDVAGPATMATTGPRYFGFVNGATLPSALGASFLTNAWDQNAALPQMSPAAAKIHDVVRGWLIDLLGLATATDVVFVTGATVANATALAAARDALLAGLGWDAPGDGLFGAPEIPVVIGARAHSTLRKSLSFIGLGRDRVVVVPTDEQGRMVPDQLPEIEGPVILCAQAGEVNTGAFDPFGPLADWVEQRHGWLHVDAAFGMWALADPLRSHLVSGLDRADSIATDGHKWLNVTYDCGIAFVRRSGALRRTFAATAGYLPPDRGFEAMHHTLGREGVARLVQNACDAAALIGRRLAADGFTVLNAVELNQVLVRLRDANTTEALISEIQADGRVWCGPTQWDGGTAMRISVSSWKTTSADADRAADVIIECAHRVTVETVR